MFTAEEMNLIHAPGGAPPRPLETPGMIQAYYDARKKNRV